MKRYYLKKSYIRDELNVFITNIILYFFKRNFEPKSKILIKMTDGLGDIVIRTKLIEEIVNEYGEKNLYFLIKEEYKFLGEILDIPVISFKKEDKYNLLKRIKKMYFINKLGIKKFINLEWSNDDFIRNIYANEKIAVEALNEEDYKSNICCTKIIKIRKEKDFNKEKENVINLISKVADNILKNKIEKENFSPNLREYFPEFKINKNIVIGIGATDRNRVCSPYKMIEFIKIILEVYPKEKIYLVGTGKREKEYSEKIIETLKNKDIISLVNKTSLKEVLERVTEAKVFIGFDSGLYNFRYTLRKKQIILLKDRNVPYFHKDDSIIALEGNDNSEDNMIHDFEYPDRMMNSISEIEFKKALIKLKE